MKRVNAILNLGTQKMQMDGTLKNDFDFELNETEIVFVFAPRSITYMELKSRGFGGSIVPRHSMNINNIEYDVMAFGSKSDEDNEISFYLIKKMKESWFILFLK